MDVATSTPDYFKKMYFIKYTSTSKLFTQALYQQICAETPRSTQLSPKPVQKPDLYFAEYDHKLEISSSNHQVTTATIIKYIYIYMMLYIKCTVLNLQW